MNNSLNRFCDDLIEDLLEYLSFEDKIKYQSVCNQWNRCLFSKQTILMIDGSEYGLKNSSFNSLNQLVFKTKVDNISNRVTVLRKNSFESVLKKCKSIKKLVITGCECDKEVLQLIADNCPILEDIELELICMNPYDNQLLDFGQKMGKKLKKLRFVYFTIDFELMKRFLYLCPKLETINCDIFAAVVDQRPDFLSKLKNLRVRVRPSDENLFEILGEKYSKSSLQSLTLYGNSVCLPSALKYISNISSLQSLTIDLCCDTSADRLVESMLLMSEKLNKLKFLIINSMVFISEQFFKTLGHFKNLSKLTVNQNLLHTKCNTNINISQLNDCKSLRQLSIIGFNFNELFFDDISLYLPQLKSIEFSLMIDNVITDRLFRMFEGLESLERFSFTLTVNKSKKLNNSSVESLMSQLILITDNGLSNLINSCHKLRIINLENISVDFIGDKTLEAIKTKEKNNKHFKFILNIRGDKHVFNSSYQNWNI